MSKVGKVWNDITGKTALKEQQRQFEAATEQAEADRIKAQNEAAAQEVFARSEGQGFGSMGQVTLGLDDKEEVDLELDGSTKRKKNLYI